MDTELNLNTDNRRNFKDGSRLRIKHGYNTELRTWILYWIQNMDKVLNSEHGYTLRIWEHEYNMEFITRILCWI